MNRRLISNKIISAELSDDWYGIDCDDWCHCTFCVYCINDRIAYEAYIYEDWLDSNERKRKILWFIDDNVNTLENILKNERE